MNRKTIKHIVALMEKGKEVTEEESIRVAYEISRKSKSEKKNYEQQLEKA